MRAARLCPARSSCAGTRRFKAVHRLREPTAKEPPSDGEIDQTVAAAKRVHAERRVEEGVTLRLGELPVNKHPADRAMHPYLAKFVHVVYEEVSLVAADRRVLGGLHEIGALLVPLSLGVQKAREPPRVAGTELHPLSHRPATPAAANGRQLRDSTCTRTSASRAASRVATARPRRFSPRTRRRTGPPSPVRFRHQTLRSGQPTAIVTSSPLSR